MSHTHTIGDDGFYFYAGKDKVERRTVKNGTGNSFTNMLYAVTATNLLERWTYTNTSSITNTGNNGSADATQGHHHTNNHEHAETYTDYQNNMPPYKAFNIWMRIQ